MQLIYQLIFYNDKYVLNININKMEYLKNEPSTPHFGNCKDNNALLKELISEKKILKYNKDIFQYVKNKEKYKNPKSEKSKNKERSKSKSKKKRKNESKENSKINYESPPPRQRNMSYMTVQVRQEIENSFDIFSENFLIEKDLAFQQFLMNEDADYLEN